METTWYTRYGTEFNPADFVEKTRNGLTRVGKPYNIDLTKGTAKFDHGRACSRCGGAGGSDKWKETGWTCFECGGSGQGTDTTARLYSAERLAKLNATQAKRDAVRLAQFQADKDARQAAVNAARAGFLVQNQPLVDAMRELSADDFIGGTVESL